MLSVANFLANLWTVLDSCFLYSGWKLSADSWKLYHGNINVYFDTPFSIQFLWIQSARADFYLPWRNRHSSKGSRSTCGKTMCYNHLWSYPGFLQNYCAMPVMFYHNVFQNYASLEVQTNPQQLLLSVQPRAALNGEKYIWQSRDRLILLSNCPRWYEVRTVHHASSSGGQLP